MNRGPNRLVSAFERILWASRLAVVAPVIFCVLTAFSAFYIATVDVISLLGQLGGYANPDLSLVQRAALGKKLLTIMIKAVDTYLLGAIILIVGMGLYELYISRIDAAEASEVASRVLLIHSLDDLKDRLAKVILLFLIVEFLQQALQLTYHSPVDLFYLAVGILFIGGALFLSGRTNH